MNEPAYKTPDYQNGRTILYIFQLGSRRSLGSTSDRLIASIMFPLNPVRVAYLVLATFMAGIAKPRLINKMSRKLKTEWAGFTYCLKNTVSCFRLFNDALLALLSRCPFAREPFVSRVQ